MLSLTKLVPDQVVVLSSN